ncbi:MAG: transposase [Candidatus Paceibacterota bacterium]
MPRNNRVDIEGEIYHVINRSNARMQIFNTDEDYELFEAVLKEVKDRTNMKIYSYCIMPNHWHFIVSPKNDGDLSKFMAWLTMTHTQRWHAMHKSIGTGHLYQGRYKSFLVQSNEYFNQVCRYVERNPVRAKLIKKAEDWKWGSLWKREKGNIEQQKLLNIWPVDIPKNYLDWVNESEPIEILESVRGSVNKGKPFGKMSWTNKKIDEYKLKSTIHNPGRPKNGS